MTWDHVRLPPRRRETHFGDRIVTCFADRPASVGAVLAAAVADRPDAEALVCDGLRLDYRSLQARVIRVAAGLARRGVAAGDRVALLLDNRAEFVLALFGCLHLGAIAVPLGTRLQGPEIAYILEQAGARLVIHEDALSGRLEGARDAVALSAFASLEADGAMPPPHRAQEEDTAVILYTSGTTGRPKGAMLSHFNIVHSLMHFQHCMGIVPGDRLLLAVPASHVTGLIALILAAVQGQACLIMLNGFRAREFLALAAAERMTHSLMVPAMYNLCLLDPDLGRFDLSAWRIGGYGGAPMPEATIAGLAEALPALQLMNAYGATETTSPATMMPAHLTAGHLDSVGLVLPCADIVVVDAEGHEVPPGHSGELLIGGPMVVRGYWENPQATADNLVAGYWRSGDVGAIDADGFVRVFDRVKDMLNRGGYKIYSVEVENILAAHPGVLEAAVIGKPCPVLGERVHAVVARRDPGLQARALSDFCAARLADYKVPESFTFSDDPLPRNANGKLLKRALRAEFIG